MLGVSLLRTCIVRRRPVRVEEVFVQWTEVPISELNVVKATINMVIDMLRMRFAYTFWKWTVDAANSYKTQRSQDVACYGGAKQLGIPACPAVRLWCNMFINTTQGEKPPLAALRSARS